MSPRLLEFVAFLNVASFMLSGSLVALTAAGLLVLALVALFPTTSRVVNWIDRQLRLLTDARNLARWVHAEPKLSADVRACRPSKHAIS